MVWESFTLGEDGKSIAIPGTSEQCQGVSASWKRCVIYDTVFLGQGSDDQLVIIFK